MGYLDNQFPVRENVKCFLFVIKYIELDNDRHAIEFVFKTGNKFLNHRFYRPDKDEQDYQKKVLNFIKCVESIILTYLTGQELVKINKEANKDINKYIELVNISLKDKQYWRIPVEIKTLITSKKRVILPRFPDFIKRVDNDTIDLKYSKYEKNFNNKNILNIK